MQEISSAFFVPLYFAVVGLRLDLLHHLDVWFLCWFLAVACGIKSVSVWIGARLAGEPNRFAVSLAVAMNARGGPGIVLASAVYGAQIISESFFTALVLVAILTSQVAGIWLEWIIPRAGGDWLCAAPARPGIRHPIRQPVAVAAEVNPVDDAR